METVVIITKAYPKPVKLNTLVISHTKANLAVIEKTLLVEASPQILPKRLSGSYITNEITPREWLTDLPSST